MLNSPPLVVDFLFLSKRPVSRLISGHSDGLLFCGMNECNRLRMEGDSAVLKGDSRSVLSIADNGVADGGELDAYLMRKTG